MRRGLALACVLLGWLPAGAWSADPAGSYGVWSGMLTEVIVAGQRYSRYEVAVTLAPNRSRIDYESLGCGGELRLVRKSGRLLQFRDELEYGQDVCASGGRTELYILDSGRAVLRWFDADGVLKVEGNLRRQRQVMI